MEEPQNGPAVRFLPGQKTQGFGSVRVTNPPRHSGSGFRPGNDPNRTEPPAKNRTAGGLPGPVANTKRHGCMLRVQGWVTPALFSRLAMSLRSLAIILPLYYSTILTSTFATVSTDIPSYEAIHGRKPV